MKDDIITRITNRWFLTEPLLFMTLTSHEVKPEKTLRHLIRSGQGRIEYRLDEKVSEAEFEENLRAELIRILLRHPYRRYEKKEIAYMASNITLNENYKFSYLNYTAQEIWGDNWSYRNRNFEFYYHELLDREEGESGEEGEEGEKGEDNENEGDGEEEINQKNADTSAWFDCAHQNSLSTCDADSDKNPCKSVSSASRVLRKVQASAFKSDDETTAGDASPAVEGSALWEEDDFMDEKVKQIVEWANSNMQWGTLPGVLKDELIASLETKIDYRKIIRGFRASVLASDKKLTRFRPSRRFGFMYMGKKSELVTNLLIAVDVSASITDKDVQVFYSVVNRFFKYGIQSIDVLQFDTEVKLPLLTIKKAKKKVMVRGRGGTSFQPVVDFFENSCQKRYDGLIIFTDGEASVPKMKTRTIRKTLWICNEKKTYDTHEAWMKKHGRCCWVNSMIQ